MTAANEEATDLEKQITDRVQRVFDFLRDHRYDPAEIYGDQDYLKEIPDPCVDPLSVLGELVQIIEAFGNTIFLMFPSSSNDKLVWTLFFSCRPMGS